MTQKQQSASDHSIEEKKQEEVIETVSLSIGKEEDILPAPPKFTAEQERKLYRKIDLWLMPILTLMYLASFLDRGMGLREMSDFSRLSHASLSQEISVNASRRVGKCHC